MMTTTKEELIESWINGNTMWVRKKLKNKSKLFVVDLIHVLVGQYGYRYHNAITVVRAMLK